MSELAQGFADEAQKTPIKILFYDGNTDFDGTHRGDMDRRDVKSLEGQNIFVSVFDTAREAVLALRETQFDAIVTTTGMSRNFGNDGRASGMVVQDEAVQSEFGGKRILLTYHLGSSLEADVKYRYPENIAPPIVVERKFGALSENILEKIIPQIRPAATNVAMDVKTDGPQPLL